MEYIRYYNPLTHDISYGYNASVKVFADGSKKIKYTNYTRFKGGNLRKKSGGECSKKEKDRLNYNNLYKSKSNLIDLVYHNAIIKPWKYFVTLTFDPKKVDSLDYEVVSEALAKWLDNMKHQNKSMAYVLTPELHESGRIHFHGLFRDVSNWNLEPARYKDGNLIVENGVQIYNLTNYKYGFTTVSEINNQEAVSVYMSKYMTKELIALNYKKRYWSSKNLRRPKIQYAMWDESTLEFHIDKCNIQYENKHAIFLNQEVNIIDTVTGTSEIESMSGPLL